MIPCAGLWARAKKAIDALPNDELLTSIELARVIQASRNSININLDFAHPEIAARSQMTVVHGPLGTPQRRMWGNVRAIRKLRRALPKP